MVQLQWIFDDESPKFRGTIHLVSTLRSGTDYWKVRTDIATNYWVAFLPWSSSWSAG